MAGLGPGFDFVSSLADLVFSPELAIVDAVKRIVPDYWVEALFAVVDQPVKRTIHLCRYCCTGVTHIEHVYDPWTEEEYFDLDDDGIVIVERTPTKTCGGCTLVWEYVGTIVLPKDTVRKLEDLKKRLESLSDGQRKRLYRIALRLLDLFSIDP